MNLNQLLSKHFSFFNSRLSNQKGFTLLEIMVVFSMLALIGGFGFASFVAYSRQQAVEQAASALKTQIERAKFNAISRVASSGCTSPDTLESYSFRIANTTSYETSVGCRDDATGLPSGFFAPQVFRMPQNVTLNPANAVSPGCRIKFETLSSVVSASGPCTPAGGTIAAFTISGYGLIRSVQVDSSGNVRVL